ncbi:MAG TPA: hypothetical protein VGM32_18985 [Rhodopila sp.]
MLSSRLDPEDLREVIRSYQACIAATIKQLAGLIARYVGAVPYSVDGQPPLPLHETCTVPLDELLGDDS